MKDSRVYEIIGEASVLMAGNKVFDDGRASELAEEILSYTNTLEQQLTQKDAENEKLRGLLVESCKFLDILDATTPSMDICNLIYAFKTNQKYKRLLRVGSDESILQSL